jgi:hypothetical protein
MSFECIHCKKSFTTNSNLTKHQKTTKKCLKIQKEKTMSVDNNLYKCKFCNKDFTTKQYYEKHIEICVSKLKQDLSNIEKTNKMLILENDNKEKNINELKLENKLLKEQLKTDYSHNYIKELQDKIQEIAIKAIEQKNEVICNMTKKYLKRQPRKQYECSNVVYIITTPSLQKDRRYILGKAKNLTNRLSTYNKTDEHEVIFYQECDCEDTMSSLETITFQKLREFREQANRERFILPENKNIDFFIDTVKNCFEFLK